MHNAPQYHSSEPIIQYSNVGPGYNNNNNNNFGHHGNHGNPQYVNSPMNNHNN